MSHGGSEIPTPDPSDHPIGLEPTAAILCRQRSSMGCLSYSPVGPRLVVTVAHNLFDVPKAGTSKMVLVQTGREHHIEIVRPRSVSTTHDIVLLETATPMKHHLTVASVLPHGLADQFHAAGYSKGRFQEDLKRNLDTATDDLRCAFLVLCETPSITAVIGPM